METSIFDFLGDDMIPASFKEAKEKPKKEKKEQKEKKVVGKYNITLPATFHFQLINPIVVTAEDMGVEKVNEKEIMSFLAHKYEYILEGQIAKGDESNYLFFNYTKSFALMKESSYKLYFGDKYVKDITKEASQEELAKELSELFGVPDELIRFAYDDKKAVCVCLLKSVKPGLVAGSLKYLLDDEVLIGTGETDKADEQKSEESIPSDFSGILNGADFNAEAEEVTDEEEQVDEAEADEEADEDADEETDEENGSKTKTDTLKGKEKTKQLEQFKKALLTKYPFFKEHLGFFARNGINVAYLSDYEVATPTKKKEKDYEIEGYTLSIIFEKFALTKEDFKGKKRATLKDLCEFLKAHDYPEYQESRTSVITDEKNKLHLVQIAGSRKGGISELGKQVTDLYHTEGSFSKILSDENTEIFVRKNPVGFFCASKQTYCFNAARLALPRIPEFLIKKIFLDFKKMSDEYGTEWMAQIFYKVSKKEYFIYYPEQAMDSVSVEAKRNLALEADEDNILVMDIHSHHKMPTFFSRQDDSDEIETRFFGVMGDFYENTARLLLRAGVAGCFIKVNVNDIIETNDVNLQNGLIII